MVSFLLRNIAFLYKTAEAALLHFGLALRFTLSSSFLVCCLRKKCKNKLLPAVPSPCIIISRDESLNPTTTSL